MTTPIHISDVTLAAATDGERAAGLVGWVSCTVGHALRLDGITLRRTTDHRLTLSFPARTDRRGRQHPFVRPLDDCARRAFELAVFRALGLDAGGGCDER
jgi:hypothetical protein